MQKYLLKKYFADCYPKKQIENILKDERCENGILSSLNEILDNPYILTEEYVGDDYGDEISFTKLTMLLFLLLIWDWKTFMKKITGED